MSVDWDEASRYMSLPGSNEPLRLVEGFLQGTMHKLRFPINHNIADFINSTNINDGETDIQMDYWESPKPGIRWADHPVQIQFAEQRFRYLEKLISFEDIDSALDIGCGNGVGTTGLKKRVNQVFGLDISGYLLKQLPENIIGLRCYASKIPLRDKSVDLTMAWEAVHHIKDPEPVFAEIRRVTRKWVILFEPNRRNPLQTAFSIVVAEERLGLRNTRAYLSQLMANAGLHIVHYATVGCLFPNKSPAWLTRICRMVPFRIPWLGISHVLIAEVPEQNYVHCG